MTGNFAGQNGTVTLNANFVDGSKDTLTITGNVTGNANIVVTGLGQLGAGQSDTDRPLRIDGVVTVQGTVESSAFTASVVEFGAVAYQLRFDSTNKRFDLVRFFTNECETTGNGVYTCSGSNQIGAAQSLTASGDDTLSATLYSETTVDTGGTAFTLTQTGGTGGITFTQSANGKEIKGAQDAIAVSNTDGGAISINVNGTVTAASGDGIRATNDDDGSGITITAAAVSRQRKRGLRLITAAAPL